MNSNPSKRKPQNLKFWKLSYEELLKNMDCLEESSLEELEEIRIETMRFITHIDSILREKYRKRIL